jgi:hypothetical protein
MSPPRVRKAQRELTIPEKISQKLDGLNGAIRFAGLVSAPGALSLYLVWNLTDSVAAKLDRMIVVLEAIARTLNATVR